MLSQQALGSRQLSETGDMRTARQFGLLAAMLIAFSGLLYPRDIGQAGVGAAAGTLGCTNGKQESGSSARDSDSRAALCRKAESKAAQAVAFRHKQTSNDFARALPLFQESARLFQLGHFNAQATEMYLQMGEVYFILSEYDKAVGSYRLALRLARTDPDRRCRVLSHVTRVYATTGHTREANAYSSQVENVCEGSPDRKTQAEALIARGEALYDSGDSVKSEELFRRAQELFAEVGDPDGQAQASLMLAYPPFRAGERAEGVRLAGRALTLWDSTGNRDGMAQARAALGLFAVLTGEFETAQCNYGRASEIFRDINDKDNEAIVLNGLGLVNRETGGAQASLEYYRRARANFAALHDWLGETESITGMGMAMTALQRYQHLLPLYEEKFRLAKLAKNRVLLASALADMAGVYELEHQYLNAERFYNRSLAALRSAHHPIREAQISIRLAHLQASQAKYSQAIALLKHALTITEQTAQVEDIARAQYELAYVHRRLGRLDDALQAIQRTIDIIESQRLKMAAFDSRASYFASVHKYYGLYVQLLMLLHQQDPQLHSAVKAFEASEKSKVRSLLDWLAATQQDAPCDELLTRQLQVPDRAAATATDSKQTPAAEATPALTLGQIQAEIAGDDAILLEYALGDEKSYLWVVDKEQVTSHELPAAKKLNELVHSLRDAVTARQPKPDLTNIQYLERRRRADKVYPKYAAELSRLLLGPVPLGSAKRVIIVPEGPLQYVPFAALSVLKEKGGRAILAADHEVIILPSASALGTLRSVIEHRPTPKAVAAVFADPVFERNDPRVSRRRPGLAPAKLAETARSVWRDVQPGSRRIPPLPGSREEAKAVLDSLGPDAVFVAEGFLASRDTVLNHDLGSYRIVHFATHGILDEKHPERSGLVLSLVNEKGEPQEGYLTLNDIYTLKLSGNLVVLSSCDSGLGKDLSSEGIIGLPRAFLRAGAKSVIATLWKVDDEATAQLMKHFYARLHEGELPALALRNAQFQLSQDKRFSDPYYWAAFVFQGDYR